MIFFNFLLASILLAFSIILAGAPLSAFWDVPSVVAIVASVLLFAAGAGHWLTFCRGIGGIFSPEIPKDEATSKFFEKLVHFTLCAGLFWTLLGFIIILGSMDPETVGVGLAVSLLTVFYSLFFSLFLFWPIAVRTKPEECRDPAVGCP